MKRNWYKIKVNIAHVTGLTTDQCLNLNLNNISVHQKSCENILIYNVAYRSPYSTKPLWIIFDKVDGCIRKYDTTKYPNRQFLIELGILLC